MHVATQRLNWNIFWTRKGHSRSKEQQLEPAMSYSVFAIPAARSIEKISGPPMTISDRPVIIKEIPPSFDSVSTREFLYDLRYQIAGIVRPAVVLDCTRIGIFNRQALQLFLGCLEEAMKRNGDVRLAGLHPDAWGVLKIGNIDRLFQSFSTVTEAINSYRRPWLDRKPRVTDPTAGDAAANAA